MVEIFNDAVEIISPGWFVQGQDPEEPLSGRSVSSKTRNELIAQTLFKSGDIESQGTGIKRIKDFCDEADVGVEYVHVPEGTKLVFHRKDAFGQSLVMGAPPSSEVRGGNQKSHMSASDREAIALELASRNGRVTTAMLADATGTGKKTASATLKKLAEQGRLVRHGSSATDPDQYYTLG